MNNLPETRTEQKTVGMLLKENFKAIQSILPKHLTPEKMARIVMNEVRRNPQLALCTSESFIGAVLVASQTGLEIGPFGYAYLIPRKNTRSNKLEVNFQLGYKGGMRLAWNSSQVGGITAAVAYANDEFDYALGTSPFIKHVPTSDTPGEITHFYAIAKNLQSGEYQFKVMSKRQVDDVKNKYAQGTDKSYSPWKKSYEAMGMKTCIIRLCKFMPMSTEAQHLVALDEMADVGADQNLAGELPADFQDLDNLIPTQGQLTQEETDNKADSLKGRLEAESKNNGAGEEVSRDSLGGAESSAPVSDFELMEMSAALAWLHENKRPGNEADKKLVNDAAKSGDKETIVKACQLFADRKVGGGE